MCENKNNYAGFNLDTVYLAEFSRINKDAVRWGPVK